MSIKILHKMCDLIRDKDIFYVTYGKLTQNILQSIIATARHGVYDSVTLEQYSEMDMDNLIAITIEMVQNISKYRVDTKNYNNDLILITTNGNITVSTSNLADIQNKDKISKNIDFLNSLDATELRKYARETIRKHRNKDVNSAGLGLIEIARISKKDIEYSFDEYKKDTSLFHFSMTVSL